MHWSWVLVVVDCHSNTTKHPRTRVIPSRVMWFCTMLVNPRICLYSETIDEKEQRAHLWRLQQLCIYHSTLEVVHYHQYLSAIKMIISSTLVLYHHLRPPGCLHEIDSRINLLSAILAVLKMEMTPVPGEAMQKWKIRQDLNGMNQRISWVHNIPRST